MTKPFEKLTPEELQRLRADMQEALDAVKQKEAEEEIHERTLDPVVEKTDAWNSFNRWNGVRSSEKISGGDAGMFQAFLIGDDFDLEEFKKFAGDVKFSTTFEITNDQTTFKHLDIGSCNFLYPGDYVFKNNDGKFLGSRAY
jgi:hypothetical protein